MSKHKDEDKVEFYYESSRNISFQNTQFSDYDDSGYTWGEWKEMSQKDQQDIIQEYLWELVDVGVVDWDDDET